MTLSSNRNTGQHVRTWSFLKDHRFGTLAIQIVRLMVSKILAVDHLSSGNDASQIRPFVRQCFHHHLCRRARNSGKAATQCWLPNNGSQMRGCHESSKQSGSAEYSASPPAGD